MSAPPIHRADATVAGSRGPSASAGTARRAGTVSLLSLGCPKNRVDSEVMLGELVREGFRLTGDPAAAETVIINTCGFIEEAKQESIDAILEVAAQKAETGQRLLVAGCMVQRYGCELAREIPEIDGFVGLDDLRQVAAIARGDGAAGGLVQLGGPPPPKPSHLVFDHTAPRTLTTRGHAYLKVAEGCNNPCTFCAIPHWRGAFRSRTVESLVAEARRLEEAGIQELCLVAQDTTRYGQDLGLGKHGLVRLLEALLAATDLPWVRFLYAYPTTLDREVLRLMGSEPRLCSYLDMPLQHTHPEVLKAMRRGGGPERYRWLLDQARELVPDVFLRTTFIVGFPGETEEHLEHLLGFVQAVEFDHLGAFVYSPEPGTPGEKLVGRVPGPVARRRRERLLAVQEPISRRRRERLVGQRMTVLVEGVCEETEHLLQARHQGMAPEVDGRILVNDGRAPAATLAQVEVSAAYADDLVAHVVGPVGAPGVVPAEAVLDPWS
jgi:ribosomal protein S12 methylthiotransferase